LDRVFLDANVLFSAAYRAQNGLLRLWSLADATLLTSAYALAEARRNLTDPDALLRLDALVQAVATVAEPAATMPLPAGVSLPAKDVPILRAAINARATHLITGDRRHFGPLFGQTVVGVLVQMPADYLAAKP
jgi:predicted nucleic acid-binding protein